MSDSISGSRFQRRHEPTQNLLTKSPNIKLDRVALGQLLLTDEVPDDDLKGRRGGSPAGYFLEAKRRAR
jgi:hypothetical protein